MISASIATSESFNAMSEWARLSWCLMIPHLSDHGTIEGSATKLKAQTQPLSNRSVAEIASAVREMIDVEILTAYEVNDRLYLNAPSFDTHQVNLHKRTPKPKFPTPEEGTKLSGEEYEKLALSRKFPESPGSSRPKKGRKGRNRKEGKAQGPLAKEKNGTEGRFSDDSREMRAAADLLAKLRERDSDFTQPDLQKWAEDFDGIFRIDGRDPAFVDEVISFVVADESMSQYLLSPGALRKTTAGQWKDGSYKFDSFVKKMRSRKNSSAGSEPRGAAAGAAI